MPHVVLGGPVDLEAYARDFEEILVRKEGDVLRARQAYLSRDRRAVLIDALVVEAGRKQPFYIKITAHDRGGATLRVDPITHPERSEGVRCLVAEVAASLLRQSPGAAIAETSVVIPSVRARDGGAP